MALNFCGLKKVDHIRLLQTAIQLLYNCDARHLKTVHVEEKFQGASLWQGFVEVFEVTGHPKANLCYGWLHQIDANHAHPVILLNKFPVNSPENAVRASIAMSASINPDHPGFRKPGAPAVLNPELNQPAGFGGKLPRQLI